MEFRIDDVCLNTDGEKLLDLVGLLLPHGTVVVGVNVMCYTPPPDATPAEAEFVFPLVLTCPPDEDVFWQADRVGVPPVVAELRSMGVEVASHGLCHTDHRMLCRQAQALSILQSCRLLGADTFIPPWHKHNADTEAVCTEHAIHLVRWGTHLHALYNPFTSALPRPMAHGLGSVLPHTRGQGVEGFYFHPFDVQDPLRLERWLEGEEATL